MAEDNNMPLLATVFLPCSNHVYRSQLFLPFPGNGVTRLVCIEDYMSSFLVQKEIRGGKKNDDDTTVVHPFVLKNTSGNNVTYAL